ncbi:GNS1/SUR4 family [Popillia japonica]|uniref:Elongation of very long chain fatty acids protein n=1 Tax=Popillia japonica TaxID=7064 RepID=A0AAW1JXG4_POPJA
MNNDTLVGSVFDKYDVIFKGIADPRVAKWVGFGHPFGCLAVISTYLYLVRNYLPKYMQNRKPYNIQRLIQAYDLFQVIACSLLVYRVLSNGWSINYSLELGTFSTTPKELKTLDNVWYNALLKFIDLLDTVFFILRKKDNQVTNLHLYHHCTTFFFGWSTTQFVASGSTTFTILLNTLVHTVMYSYYFLSTLGPDVQKKIAIIKPKITVMQMVQFWLLAIHTITLMRYNKGIIFFCVTP